MAKFFPVFSGSRGNAVYIESNGAALLIDCGCSLRAIQKTLEAAGFSLDAVQGVLITHEHSDHVSALRTLAKHRPVPFYTSEQTADTLLSAGLLSGADRLRPFTETAEIGAFSVRRFPTSHDCAGSSGYRITLPDGRQIAVCTDLGVVTDAVRNGITGCELVMLESNHDVHMLQTGGYPYPLKQRILSEQGHLSNTACAAELPALVKAGAKRLVLAHLSQENNRPQIAAAAAKAALLDSHMQENSDYLLYVAAQQNNRYISF